MRAFPLLTLGAVLLATRSASAEESPFGALTLVDEVRCGDAADPHPLLEDPIGATSIETIAGVPTRTMANTGGARYFAYVVGKDKGLTPGAAYVLEVDFPEDAPRSLFVLNRGSETARGISTGTTLGDVLETYTHQNHESLSIPLSGKTRTFRLFFHLHDRFPEIQIPRGEGSRPRLPKDGFHVIVAQSSSANAPTSKGAAASRIRLYAVPDEAKLALTIHYPPTALPRRHVFFREEMSDGVVSSGTLADRGLDDPLDWYEFKAKRMRVLGMNTFGKDLLEFGSNQGWDSTAYGGNDWYYMPAYKERWEKLVLLAAKYGYDVLPYYEYSGSKGAKGLGFEKRARPLTRTDAYTHIDWSETANVDITDPATLTDTKKLLDATIGVHKDKAKFLGAWFRTRVSNMPISFGDRCLGLFATEANGGAAVDRATLQADSTLRTKYYGWWYGKRRDYLLAVRDHLRTLVPGAKLMFTPVSGEPGPDLSGGIVTDDPTRFPGIKGGAQSFDEVVSKGAWLAATLAMPGTWGGWEWQHSLPPADPSRYANDDGVQITYPFHRLYSVSSPAAFDAYRGASGLAAIRMYSLNEDSMEGKLGYFVADVDRAGPYSMLPEARAVAFGDPSDLGYLSGHDFNRGFPEYTRAFHAAYLALPALPSKIVADAASDREVIVRAMDAGGHGTYLAAVNVALTERAKVRVKLPTAGVVRDLVADVDLPVSDGAIELSFYPGELKAMRITPSSLPPGETPDGGVVPGADGGRVEGGVDDAAPNSASADPSGESAGCSCRMHAHRDESAGVGFAVLLGAVIARRRVVRLRAE